MRDLRLVLPGAGPVPPGVRVFTGVGRLGIRPELPHDVSPVEGFVDEEGQAAVIGAGARSNFFIARLVSHLLETAHLHSVE